MNNTSLKNKIEKAAGVYLKTSEHKMMQDTRYEATVSAYQIIEGVKSQKSFAGTFSWLASERAYAVRSALIQMADKLNVTITDDERNAVARVVEANNTARMDLYCKTH